MVLISHYKLWGEWAIKVFQFQYTEISKHVFNQFPSQPYFDFLYKSPFKYVQWTKEKFHEISNLRALLRFKALKAEIENTASELQIMRPMGDQSHMRDALLVGYVKNGRHPDKWFLQVHYLKVKYENSNIFYGR